MPLQITSTANPRIKAAARLRDRSGRDDQGRIIIDGVREIHRAFVAGVVCEELYFFPPLCTDHEHEVLIERAGQTGADLIEVSPVVMEKLAYGNRVEGLVAVAKKPERQLADLQLTADSLLAVVEGVEKPGNLGAILRTADAAGLTGLVVADGGTDLFNPNVIRASLGAVFTVPVACATSAAVLTWLRAKKVRMLAARVDGAIEYASAKFHGSAAIILGSEAFGLSDNWRAADIQPIKLPMLGQIDSLNLSATAAVLFYEALRQRRA